MLSHPSLARGALLLAIGGLLSASQGESPADITLPAGPFAELAQRALLVPDGPESFDLVGSGEPWPPWSDHGPTGWGGMAPWNEWIALLRQAADAPNRKARDRRARLMILARDQERYQDAWEHLLAAQWDAAQWDAAERDAAKNGDGATHPDTPQLLALLWPGISREDLRRGTPLSPGVLLSPALPPFPVGARHPRRALVGLDMEHRDIRIGESRVRMRLVVESDGVQIDVEHLAGPAAELSVLLPVPLDQRLRILYADWEEVGTERRPVAVRVEPGERPFTIWGRFRSEPLRWPRPATSAREHPTRAPFAVRVAPERMGEGLLAHFTSALGILFDRPATLSSDRAPAGDGFLEPIAIHLDPPGEGHRKLLGMISLVEAWFLETDAAR